MKKTNESSLRVLVVEDEQTIIEFLRVGLTYEHWDVTVAQDGPSGLAFARQKEFDLIILDIMLPGLDGFELCRQLREEENDVPIIMLTARKDVADRVGGLNIGADDYITKPFSFDELLARINAVLRRRGKSAERPILHALDLSLNPETHEAYKDGTPLDLSAIDFALLELFMRHPRRVFTRETLLNRIWSCDYVGDTNVVEVHIGHLRQAISDNSREVIRTIYGVGYSFRPNDA